MDLLTSLSDSGLEPLVQAIFCELSFLDLKCCGLVSKRWNALIHAHWEHQELKRLGTRFRKAARAFTSSKIQCHRERSVSTVSAIALDEAIVACGLGGSGMLQVWDRFVGG